MKLKNIVIYLPQKELYLEVGQELVGNDGKKLGIFTKEIVLNEDGSIELERSNEEKFIFKNATYSYKI